MSEEFKKGDRIIVHTRAVDGYGDVGWIGEITSIQSARYGEGNRQAFIVYDVERPNPMFPTTKVSCGWIHLKYIRHFLDIKISPKVMPISRKNMLVLKPVHPETLWKEVVG